MTTGVVSVLDTNWCLCAAQQNPKVSAYFTSKQILLFGSALQYYPALTCMARVLITDDPDVRQVIGWDGSLNSCNAEIFFINQLTVETKGFLSIWNHHNCLSQLFVIHLNTYVHQWLKGYWHYKYFALSVRGWTLDVRISRLWTSDSDV